MQTKAYFLTMCLSEHCGAELPSQGQGQAAVLHPADGGGFLLLSVGRGGNRPVHYRPPDHPHRPERQSSPGAETVVVCRPARGLQGAGEKPTAGGTVCGV